MSDMPRRRKLIEVALPLDEINFASKADKARNHGTLRNLHKWFAAMPLPAWRALLFSALIDDPGDPERRAYLLDVVKRLVAKGADLPDLETMEEARTLIAAQFPEGAPSVLDPFCGGGSTLVEAQRLGLKTQASDMNPVPILISRTLTDLLPKAYGRQPVHPEVAEAVAQRKKVSGQAPPWAPPLFPQTKSHRLYVGHEGLIRDVGYYAEQIRQAAWQELEATYPTQTAELPIAWLWARTAQCQNPACGIETVLTTSWWLSKRKNDLAWIQPEVSDGSVHLRVVTGQRAGNAPSAPKPGRGASFVCLSCDAVLDEATLIEQGSRGAIGLRMTCVVVERDGRRVHRAPTEDEIEAAEGVLVPDDFPDVLMPDNPRWFSGPRFGFKTQGSLYTPRQLVALMAFARLVAATPAQIVADGGSEGWAKVVTTVLALVLGRVSQGHSSQAVRSVTEVVEAYPTAFTRNDMPMTWDFFEGSLFGKWGPSWLNSVDSVVRSFKNVVADGVGTAVQSDARTASLKERGLVATDPPYFDAIGYAYLSDYFYVWHRLALRHVHPDLYATIAAPKQGELTAVPSHHGNDREAARLYFIHGFTETFINLQRSSAPDLPMLVVYASKEQKGGSEEETRWSSILTAMMDASLEITGSWPIHGTGERRMIGRGTNAVATYVVMVCRPRLVTAGTCSLADFNRSLRRELKPAVTDLQAAGILPVDLAQAAMGPGMQVYSRHRDVVDQSGKRVPVEQALRLINAALGEVLDEQEGELDPPSRFAVAWWQRHHWDAALFGEADALARPQGISVDDVVRAGVVHYPKPGYVAALGKGGIDRNWTPTADGYPTAWEAVHHLAYRLIEGGGTSDAGRLMGDLGVLRDPSQALVYRLHDIAAKKGWTQDQERYNALIGSWSDLIAISATEKDGLF